MGIQAEGIRQTVYVKEVRTSSWQAFRAEALRLGMSRAEALEIMIAAWIKEEK